MAIPGESESCSLLVVCFGLIAADDGVASPPKDSADRAAFEAAQAKAGHDAKAHVRLALWCESHGLDAERMKRWRWPSSMIPPTAWHGACWAWSPTRASGSRPDDISRRSRTTPSASPMQEYFHRRAKTSETADDQWKLALWCEQNGLKDQAIAQYHAVLRRDPSRSPRGSGWGSGGRRPMDQAGVAGAQKHEIGAAEPGQQALEAATRAAARGAPSRDKTRRADAKESIMAVTDPRSVAMIWAVFVPKGAEGQQAAVRLLANVDSPGASRRWCSWPS